MIFHTSRLTSFVAGSFIKMLKFAINVLYIKFILLFRGINISGD